MGNAFGNGPAISEGEGSSHSQIFAEAYYHASFGENCFLLTHEALAD